MKSKSEISTNAIYVIGFVLITIVLSLVAIQIYIKWQDVETRQAACLNKLVDYCIEWYTTGYGDVPYDWDTTAPAGCSEFDVDEPSEDDCEEILI